MNSTSTLPLASVTRMVSVEALWHVSRMLPCVESALKFCAMPLYPAATTVPPVMVAAPS